MKRKIIILTTLFVILIGVVILFQIGIQNVTTSKKIYNVGEKISYSWSDFRIQRCEVGDQIEFYKLNKDAWERLPSTPPKNGVYFCLNGELQSSLGPPMCCGECKLFYKPFEKGFAEREIKIFEKTEDELCYNSKKEPLALYDPNELLPSYISTPAPAGIYKIQFGKAETIFEIK